MGNARRYVEGYSGDAVHPHVHGERFPPLPTPQFPPGSSPRTWGTPNQFLPFFSVYLVHPHVHGERFQFEDLRGKSHGSSPRTWGTRTVPLADHEERRFIPTYMGNAISSRITVINPAVHPHVHGERPNTRRRRRVDLGSSPRTWGTPGRYRAGVKTRRFIPTYMGNADLSDIDPFLPSVHPHVHGERRISTNCQKCQTGSSPRTWGTRGSNSRGFSCRRFIPTYMGNANHRSRLSI